MKESELRTRSRKFALDVIGICDNIDTRKGRGVLINQTTKSATSIGANIYEANYGASKADFINKMQISLKECIETEYWIDILHGSNCIDTDTKNVLLQDCGVIHRMLVKTITTAKKNLKN